MTIKVLIVDDHEIFRDGLKILFKRYPDIEVVGEASNGLEALQLLRETEVDIVFLDIKMPIMDGLECLERIRKIKGKLPVIILTMFDDEKIMISSLELGANAYLMKNASGNEIFAAVEACLQDKPFYCNYTSAKLTKMITEKSLAIDHKPLFTEREIQVMKLITQEMSNREISEVLKISVEAIETYREKIQEKIGARNTAGIVVYAIKNKLVN
jgi:two-component system, NarL family, response regulator NreC